MLLDIIIPQYSENEEKIKPLLDSIINQKNIDFDDIDVTIVNDCSDTILSEDFIKQYRKMHLIYIKNDKNTGPGLARQKGVDFTDKPYIMFIDADDTLFDDLVLSKIIGFIKKCYPSYFVTNIASEFQNGDNTDILLLKGRDTFPWMHGKVYKRIFLKERNIRFSEHIRHLEDGYFTTCVLGNISPNDVIYLDVTTIRWKRNMESLTRKKEDIPYSVRHFDEIFDTPKYTYEYLCSIKSYLRQSYLIMSIFGIYILLNSNLFDDPKFKDMKEEYNKRLALEYVNKYRNFFIIVSNEKLNELYMDQARQLIMRSKVVKIHKDLRDFLVDFDFTNKL